MSTAAALRTPESVLGDERIISADSRNRAGRFVGQEFAAGSQKRNTQSFPREIPPVKNPEDGTPGRASMRWKLTVSPLRCFIRH